MNVIKIDKTQWKQGIDRLSESYLLFGPVKENNVAVFETLESGRYPEMEQPDTVLSPKSILFPQSEKILEADLDELKADHHIMKRPKTDDTPRAVLGIRPYDAKAVLLVKLNFDTEEYKDPDWLDALKKTTFAGLAVNLPSIHDFSTQAGSGPFEEAGLDILLVDCGTYYYAKVITEKGEALVKVAGFNETADSESAPAIIDGMKKKAENCITADVVTRELTEKAVLDLYEAPFWENLAFSCINCGTCTFVCPTCWCFDIQDETHGKSCSRFRNWDSCMSPLFTLHGSGHNPRGDKISRVRQRFMHKLKYFPDKYQEGIMCVGCGRCVKHCPVNIDIRTVCNTMNAFQPQGLEPAQEER